MCAAASRGSIAGNSKHASIQIKYNTVKLPSFKCFLLLKSLGMYYFISLSAVESLILQNNSRPKEVELLSTLKQRKICMTEKKD